MRGEREAVQPVELRFDEQGAATPEAKQEAAAEASLLRGVLPPQPLLHGGAALVDELAAEGMQHVLAAEKTGQLQRRYPYMYAQAEDLALVSGACCRQQRTNGPQHVSSAQRVHELLGTDAGGV
jgi:hypothetical protein